MSSGQGRTAAFAEGPFVGRADEIARLEGWLDAVLGGNFGLALVAGEPGIGKTRLAAELASRAAVRGFTVAWGRCWEDSGAPAFWLWTQVLRGCQAADGDSDASQPVPALDPELSSLLPEVAMTGRDDRRPREHDTLLPSPLESERSRFRLFDAMGRYLQAAARGRPLLLVLDDLHGADIPSLLLLRFLARTPASAPLAILATHRESEVRADPQRADVFASLERGAERIALRGWQHDEVGRFLEQSLGTHPGDGVVAAVTDVTAGNPLFVDGFARQLRVHPDSDFTTVSQLVPDGIRTTIRQRLQPLSDATRALLDAAAVGGQRFDPRVLARVAGSPLAGVLNQLAEAGIFGLVDTPQRAAGPHAFAHPLIRQTVYTDLRPAERLDLHKRWADALEEVHRERIDEHAAEISHHHFETATEAALPRAVDLAERAAKRALALSAYEDAARLCERAVAALTEAGGSELRRCELLVTLADACLRAGQTLRAREVSAAAARLARQQGAAALHARAALYFGGVVIGVGIPDPELLQLLDDSLDLLGDGERELRAIVSARLAVRLHLPTDGPRRIRLSEQALRLAREAASDEAMAYALDARHMAQWESTDLAGQLAVADDLIRAARACGNRELVLHGIHLRIADHLEAGDIDATDREIAHYEALAGELQQSHYDFRARALRAMRAMMNGEFDRAEALAAEAVDLGNQAQSPLSIAFSAAFALALDRIRGRVQSAETIARPLVEALPTIAGIRLGLAALYADFGRSDEAAAYFASSAAADFADIPRDNNWLLTMSLAAEICARLGNASLAATLFARLEPFVDRHAVGASGWTSLGSMARPLGLLAATLGRREQAVALLERALDTHLRMRTHAFVVFSRLDLAEVLARDPRHDNERRRALALAEAALPRARALGMDRHFHRAEALLATGSAPAAVIDQPAVRREGEFWSVSFAGRMCRLRDIRGLHYLVRLLQVPGTELHCLDLLTGGATPAGATRTVPLLDEQARAAYRERLRDLRTEIDEAESCSDLGRAEHARIELDALERELSRAFGLGGRARSSGSAAERARVTVTKSLRLAVDRITAHHPPLGEHLQATLRTGTWCSYRPDPRHPICWRLD